MLKIRNINVSKGKRKILDDINLDFEPGKVYAILGANGVGKSTLLDAIFQLEQTHDVSLNEVDPKNIKEWQEQIGYMLQNFHTHTDLSALEIVLLGAYNELSIKVSDEVLTKALTLLDEFGIKHLANTNIQALSGGQRQMVSFAQVLLKAPQVLLLDEPVSALDLKHQCVLLEALKKVTAANNLISLIVIHDLNLASLFCDEVIMLYKGKVSAQGAPKSTLTKEIISQIYGVNVELIESNDKVFIRVINAI